MLKYATSNQRHVLNKLHVGFNNFITMQEAANLLRIAIYVSQSFGHNHSVNSTYMIKGRFGLEVRL